MERRPFTVAIVEDDPGMRRGIERLLNALVFEVEVYDSAEAFLARDPDSRIGCLVLDIHLPGMSGLELRNRLTAADSALPVIFITANDNDAVETVAIQAGCAAYLHKPFPANLLVTAVTNALTGLQAG
jgi:FixJ family two-component response regulator